MRVDFVGRIRDQKWLVLKASALGFAVFELLGVPARFVAAENRQDAVYET